MIEGYGLSEASPVLTFNERWPDKLGQLDKWSFCLTTAKMAVEQERR